MDACPKCGGTSGFEYTVLLRSTRAGMWGKFEGGEVSTKVLKDPQTVTCIDCGKRVKWDVARSGVN